MQRLKNILRPVYVPLALSWRRFLLRRENPLKIMTSMQTIRHIKRKQLSICRFGDGEFALMLNESDDIGFQKNTGELSKKLRDIFVDKHPRLLICIPRTMVSTIGLKKPFPANYWAYWCLDKDHYKKIASYLNGVVGTQYQFGDAMVTRPYMDWRYRFRAKRVFGAMKKLWKNKDVLIVEGEQSRLGVGNDIFAEAKTVKRILAPAKNAFLVYGELLSTVQEYSHGRLVVTALGPTATLLACELSDLGIQTLDVGHIDIEYMWYQMKATDKVAIPGKYTNEAIGGQEYSSCEDETYNAQIITRVGC